MKDFAGNELEIGDKVIVLTTGRRVVPHMIWAVVVGFTPQKVRVHIQRPNGFSEITVRDPAYVVLPLTPDTLYAIQMELQSSASWGWRDHFKDPAC